MLDLKFIRENIDLVRQVVANLRGNPVLNLREKP